MTQPVIRQDNQVQRWPHPDIRTGELFGQLERLRDDVRRLLGGLGWSEPSGAVFADGLPTPLADVEETDDAYVVEVELPGVRKDDVAVSVEGRRLSVDAERRERRSHEGARGPIGRDAREGTGRGGRHGAEGRPSGSGRAD